jgi:hypothetical protein
MAPPKLLFFVHEKNEEDSTSKVIELVCKAPPPLPEEQLMNKQFET